MHDSIKITECYYGPNPPKIGDKFTVDGLGEFIVREVAKNPDRCIGCLTGPEYNKDLEYIYSMYKDNTLGIRKYRSFDDSDIREFREVLFNLLTSLNISFDIINYVKETDDESYLFVRGSNCKCKLIDRFNGCKVVFTGESFALPSLDVMRNIYKEKNEDQNHKPTLNIQFLTLEYFNTLFTNGHFLLADKVLLSTDVKELTSEYMVSYLCATKPAKDKLKSRKLFFEKCKDRMLCIADKDTVAELLDGLE